MGCECADGAGQVQDAAESGAGGGVLGCDERDLGEGWAARFVFGGWGYECEGCGGLWFLVGFFSLGRGVRKGGLRESGSDGVME